MGVYTKTRSFQELRVFFYSPTLVEFSRRNNDLRCPVEIWGAVYAGKSQKTLIHNMYVHVVFVISKFDQLADDQHSASEVETGSRFMLSNLGA